MRGTLVALVFLIAGSSAAFAETDAEFKAMLVGKWGSSGGCSEGVLTFNADGSFASSGPGGTTDDERKGTFEVKDGHLTGSADGNAMPTVTLSVEAGTLYFINESGGKEKLVHCDG